MKIKKVEIRDYKAFYGLNEFNVEGKNLFIYGENGSGKSSFYFALKDFFQSSTETLVYDETENIFLTKAQQGKGFIEVIFNAHPSPANYNLTQNTKDEIDILLPLVLNPLNHNDINKNEHSSEIGRTVNILKTLRTELNV